MVVWAVDVIALFGCAVLSAMLEKVIAFSSHYALRFLCTMRVIGFNS